MTVLVTGKSGGSALAAVGDGLVSCATNEKWDSARMMILIRVAFILYLYLLKAVCAVEEDAVLSVTAERNIGIFFRKLIAQTEGNVRRQLIAEGYGTAVTMHVFVEKPAGVSSILIERFGRKQGITNEVPGQCVPDIVQGNKV